MQTASGEGKISALTIAVGAFNYDTMDGSVATLANHLKHVCRASAPFLLT